MSNDTRWHRANNSWLLILQHLAVALHTFFKKFFKTATNLQAIWWYDVILHNIEHRQDFLFLGKPTTEIQGLLSFELQCIDIILVGFYCPACRTTLVATRFRVAVICPIIQVPHCIRVFFYFVWFVFINHIFQFYYELCTYCNILDIYLSQNLNFVNYVLFYMKLLNYLFFSMFVSVLESCELTGVCLLLPWLIKWK